MQRGEARSAKFAPQQATKRLPEQHSHQRLLDKQTQGRAGQEEGGEATSLLLLSQHEWAHPLFVPSERLLVRGGFAQRLGQQVGSGHGQRCTLPGEQGGTAAGIADEQPSYGGNSPACQRLRLNRNQR